MKVRAEFFSRLREIAGQSQLEIELPPGATIENLFADLLVRYPALRDFERSVLFGLSVEFVDRTHELHDGDEIAIMPPVQGG